MTQETNPIGLNLLIYELEMVAGKLRYSYSTRDFDERVLAAVTDDYEKCANSDYRSSGEALDALEHMHKWVKANILIPHVVARLLHYVSPGPIEHVVTLSIVRAAHEKPSLPCIYPLLDIREIPTLCYMAAHALRKELLSEETKELIESGHGLVDSNFYIAHRYLLERLLSQSLTFLYAYALYWEDLTCGITSEHYKEVGLLVASDMMAMDLYRHKYFIRAPRPALFLDSMGTTLNVKTAKLNMPGPDIVEITLSTPGY